MTLGNWVGYCEHKTPEFLGVSEENIGKGYTLFASLAGLPQGLPWCAIFVHAVVNRPDILGKPHPGTRVLARRIRKRKLWHGKEYDPQPGDIIFMSNSRTDRIDHCGIVESSDRLTVTSVEGNAVDPKDRFKPCEGGVVARNKRAKIDPVIVGYGAVGKLLGGK